MKKEFCVDGKSFEGILVKDFVTYKLWKRADDEEMFFITTGKPSPDQIVIFEFVGTNFVFFARFSDLGSRWEVGNEHISHYMPLLPYNPKAVVIPYKIAKTDKIIVDFYEFISFSNYCKVRVEPSLEWELIEQKI